MGGLDLVHVLSELWILDVLKLSDIYRGITQVQIGDGGTTLFWKDLWQQNILIQSYPRAASYTCLEDALVKEYLGVDSLATIFHLPLSVQAREEVQQLQTLTAATVPDDSEKDKWVCVWITCILCLFIFVISMWIQMPHETESFCMATFGDVSP